MAKKRIGGRVVYVRKDGTYKGRDSVGSASHNYPSLYGDNDVIKTAKEIRDIVIEELESIRDSKIEEINGKERARAEKGKLDDKWKQKYADDRKNILDAYEAVREYNSEYLMYQKSASELYHHYTGNKSGSAIEAARQKLEFDFQDARDANFRKRFKTWTENIKKKKDGYIQNPKTKEWHKMESHDGYKSYKFVADIDSKLPSNLSGFRVVQGNTFPHKDRLKREGFRWNSSKSRWEKP